MKTVYEVFALMLILAFVLFLGWSAILWSEGCQNKGGKMKLVGDMPLCLSPDGRIL